MQFKYILYFTFLILFACEHHSSNINIKNKPKEMKITDHNKQIKKNLKLKLKMKIEI